MVESRGGQRGGESSHWGERSTHRAVRKTRWVGEMEREREGKCSQRGQTAPIEHRPRQQVDEGCGINTPHPV